MLFSDLNWIGAMGEGMVYMLDPCATASGFECLSVCFAVSINLQ